MVILGLTIKCLEYVSVKVDSFNGNFRRGEDNETIFLMLRYMINQGKYFVVIHKIDDVLSLFLDVSVADPEIPEEGHGSCGEALRSEEVTFRKISRNEKSESLRGRSLIAPPRSANVRVLNMYHVSW